MIGKTTITDAEKRHPKLAIGIGGGVVLSVLIMGGQLTLNYGRTLERMDGLERSLTDQRIQYVTQAEYQAHNGAVLRAIESQAQATRDLARQVERLAMAQHIEP